MIKPIVKSPPNAILFDWDNIKEQGETELTNKEGELLLMLEILEENEDEHME